MMQRVSVLFLSFFASLTFADDTVLKLYRPFGEATEQISPLVKNTVSGQCVSQSQLITREDAWRCQAEGVVYDPCFVKTTGIKTDVVCPKSPWIADSVQITVQTILDNNKNSVLDMASTYPWAVELVNGEKCQAIDSRDQYDGMPVRYRCSDHNVLVGHLQRCKARWSMLEKTASGVETVELAKAWF